MIPTRTSSKKRKAMWDEKFTGLPYRDVQLKAVEVQNSIRVKEKKLKPSTSFDSDFWSGNADIARLHQDRAALKSRLGFLDALEANETITLEEWRGREMAQRYHDQYLAYQQKAKIADAQAVKLRERFQDNRDSFMRLFVRSKFGYNVATTEVGRRETDDQSIFVKRMLRVYCPDAEVEARWDPVLACWQHSEVCHAAHLYPWSQVNFMDDIFGKGSSAEILSPCNGLFLHTTIERALDKGWLVIVPDVDLEPNNPARPLDDLTVRQERLKSWEKQDVKDYKVIALDTQHKEITKTQFITDSVNKLLDLHERKLVFRTNFRPRARYLWWTFLAAILKTAWQQKGSKGPNVRKANRYWGARGRYVKKNMLLGFVEELGQDVERILENAIDGGSDVESSPQGLAVVANDVIVKTRAPLGTDDEEDDDGGSEDSDSDSDEY